MRIDSNRNNNSVAQHWTEPDKSGSKKFDYSDYAYLHEIEQYKNKPYYDNLLTNPWLWSKQGSFEPSILDKVRQALGDYSTEQNYYNSIVSNREQWLAEFLENMRQQEYNSASSQVAQLKQAGLNPDLSGNVSAGGASENDQPLLANPQFGGDSSQIVSSLGSFFFNAFQLASGFAKDMVSLKSLHNQVVSQDIDIQNKLSSSVTDFLRSSIGDVVYNSDTKSFELPSIDPSRIERYAKSTFKSRSLRKRFVKEAFNSYNSAKHRFSVYGAVSDMHEAKQRLSNLIGYEHGVFGEGYSSHDLDPLVKISSRLSKLSTEVEELQKNYQKDYYSSVNADSKASAENAQNKYNKDYYSSASGSTAGEAFNESNKSNSYQSQINKVINETMSKILSDLRKSSEGDTADAYLSKALLLLVASQQLNMIPKL